MTHGKVTTVTGVIDPNDLGSTSMHEHVLSGDSGFSEFFAEEITELFGGELPHPVDQITLANLGFLRSGGGLASPILGLDDPELARHELELFREAGGRTIVDATPIGIGRDPRGLKALSLETGLHIVAATGFYAEEFWPPEFFELGVAGMVETMLGECSDGIDGTGIKPGFIKTAANRRNDVTIDRLTAAALAARETGMSVQVHNGFEIAPEESRHMFEVMLATGLDPERIIWAHAHNVVNNRNIVGMLREPSSHLVDVSLLVEILDRGANVSIDSFGTTSDFEYFGTYDVDERTMLITLAELLRRGYASQVVVGHDVMWKLNYHAYGGHGYVRLLEFVLPKLRQAGYPDAEVDMLMTNNPARLLAH
jgi:phosphotriesterase-related protein